MCGDHRSALAQELRREYRTLVTSLAVNGDALLQREASRVAFLAVRSHESSRAWAAAIEQRRIGRGRRPSTRGVERAARRAALDDTTYRVALDRLRELANQHGRAPDLAAVVVQAHRPTP
jgi:hypothetical protein